MTYSDLYGWAQAQPLKISSNSIRDQIKLNTDVSTITERWHGFDVSKLWGLCVRGPFDLGACKLETSDDFLVVLARDLGPLERRIALTKELMHVYDSPDERANTAIKMGDVFRFLSGTTRTIGEVEATEGRAYFRALAVLCPEQNRQEYINEKRTGDIADYEFAAKLQLPDFVCSTLLDDDFIDRLEL